MKINKHDQKVRIAETKLKLWIYEQWMAEHELSFVETLSCVLNIASDITRYVLRYDQQKRASDE